MRHIQNPREEFLILNFWDSFLKMLRDCYVVIGAYPEIFRGRGFEIFLDARENLGSILGFFS